MGKSVYDVLHSRYKLHRRLKPLQEQLAQAILASGKIRLDAETESNFVRLLLPAERINITFTMREINDPALQKKSYIRLFDLLARRHDEKTTLSLTSHYLAKVKEDMGRRHPVGSKVELMMARALVCCNAYPVIRLLHLEGAEIYISFGHSVGDVMDVARWQEVGENSGLQAVGGGENAVYVSCGGHPFLSKDEQRHSGDGHAALARFMIIAAQETGHNGDMIRGEDGRWVGRHSAINWGCAPSQEAGEGRLADLARTQQLFEQCQRLGMDRIAKWEHALKFYRGLKLRNWRWAVALLCSHAGWLVFKLLLRSRGLQSLAKLQRDPYPCTLLNSFFPDMLVNLEPVAEVYRRKNPKEEEAIACIEALARVPQQVVKWGHAAVRFCTPRLYELYYVDVVSSCDEAALRFAGRHKN